MSYSRFCSISQQSLLPHLSIYVVLLPHPTLSCSSPINSSLPNMCLTQQCAYVASDNQFPIVSSKSSILYPQSQVKIFLPPTTVIRFLLYLLPYLSINPFFIPIVHSSLVSYYSPSGSYERSVQPFQHSLSLFNVPIRTAHYYTLISKDSSLWQNLIPKFCLYTMSVKDYQSGLAWRFYLPHPHCRHLLRSPIIDQEGHHLTTGCPLRGVCQASKTVVYSELC